MAPQSQLDSSQVPRGFFRPRPCPEKTPNCFATGSRPRTSQGRPFGHLCWKHILRPQLCSSREYRHPERGLSFIRKPSLVILCLLSQCFSNFPAHHFSKTSFYDFDSDKDSPHHMCPLTCRRLGSRFHISRGACRLLELEQNM